MGSSGGGVKLTMMVAGGAPVAAAASTWDLIGRPQLIGTRGI